MTMVPGAYLHGGAAEAGAVQAEDIIDALLRRPAAQHFQPLIGLSLRETDETKQGGDCSYGRNMTYQHAFYPQMEMVRRCRN